MQLLLHRDFRARIEDLRVDDKICKYLFAVVPALGIGHELHAKPRLKFALIKHIAALKHLFDEPEPAVVSVCDENRAVNFAL